MKILKELCIGLLLPAIFSAGADNVVKMRTSRIGNWFALGETVKFHADQELPETDWIVGTVYDSEGRIIAKRKVSGGELNRNGWSYRPEQPGFHEITFERRGSINGAIAEKYQLKIPRVNPVTKQREILAEKTFSVDRHAVAVTVAPTAPPKEIAPIFGASVHFWAEEQEIPLAALIGFHSLRLHVISWDQIEPRKGVFNWSKVDACLERTRAAGFPDGQLVFNVIDTPKWAAARPDMEFNQNPGASPLYRGHAPQNIEDWCSFLTSLAKRYPEVKRYELWNEPNFPGYSSFFYEEPKRFVPLVTEGAAALRKVLPGVTIWLSGNEGARYREFYRELLKLGIGNSFDVLALHFRDADPEPYMLLNRRFGIPPRPWVNSEWHGCLTLPMNRNTPSEKGFARRMVLDFLLQAARGAREVDLFSILNLAGCERETLAFLREHKYNFTHLAGLFRRRPYPQPRYVASAWQLFTSSVAGELRVGKGYGFGDWKVQSYSSDAGDCLVAWHEGAKAARVDTRILAALHAETDIRRPDGSPFDPAAEVLDPESYLLIRRPLSSVVAGWRNEEQLLRGENALAIPLEHRFSGHYRRGSLFDETMREMNDL